MWPNPPETADLVTFAKEILMESFIIFAQWNLIQFWIIVLFWGFQETKIT